MTNTDSPTSTPAHDAAVAFAAELSAADAGPRDEASIAEAVAAVREHRLRDAAPGELSAAEAVVDRIAAS